MKEKMAFWWQARSSRERIILLIWGSALAILLIWFAGIAPLNKRVHTLEQRIPEQEARLNKMRAQPLIATHSKQALVNSGAADLRSTLFRLLTEKKANAELRALSSSRVEVRLPALPMKDALDLLEFLRQESGARVAVLNAKTDVDTRIVVELERAQ